MNKKTNILKIQPHTIYMMVGPTCSGKSHFIDFLLDEYGFQFDNCNTQVISSDDIRRSLLGRDHDRHSKAMLHASIQAFNLLEAELKAVCSYPINAEVVFLDTTALHDGTREHFYQLARELGYRIQIVLMDFKKTQDYLEFAEDGQRKAIMNSVTKLRQRVIPNLQSKKYDGVFRVNTRDLSKIQIDFEGWEALYSHELPDDVTYTIVGDVHGCLDEFQQMLREVGGEISPEGKLTMPENHKVILVGDFVDKGPKVLETIDFLYDNQDQILIVKGNHENFVYKFLKGKLEGKAKQQHIIDTFFTTINLIKDKPEYQEKFFHLVDNAKEFLKTSDFIVTHAPCKQKYLGKTDPKGLKNQMKMSYPYRREYETDEEYLKATQDRFAHLIEEADGSLPYHFFGHVMVKSRISYKNKFDLDRGCAFGGFLTSATFNAGGRKPFIKHVKSKQTGMQENPEIPETELPEIFPVRESKLDREISMQDLDFRDQIRVRKSAENKVNFISGTLCPADKDTETYELESLGKALEYYKEAGVSSVVLQPKYMGSRGTLYVHKDLEKCHATSRGGYTIRPERLDLTSCYRAQQEILKPYFDQGAEYVLVDGEILPWYAMGETMINRQFKVIETAIKAETDFLQDQGFEERLALLGNKIEEVGFKADMDKTRKEQAEKYGSSISKTYLNYLNYASSHFPLESLQSQVEVYSKQMELYGKEGETHFEAFAILKVIYEDREELFFDRSNEFVYREVNPTGEICVVRFNDPDYLERAEAYYARVTEDMEGVVVKPNDQVYTEYLAPFLKVRNPQYLTIIYGYDYTAPAKYKKLMRQKRIDRKLRTSIQEFEIGKRMLEIPYHEISKENKEYLNLVAHMVAEEKTERDLDPRL